MERPGILVKRNWWNGLITGINNLTPDDLPLLPADQTWLRQADVAAIRAHIAAYWPSQFFRHTANPVAKMTVYNDFFDAGDYNQLWNLPEEYGTRYIVYSQKWRERTGDVFDHFDVVAAGRAIVPPPTPLWWISAWSDHTFTIMDSVQGMYFITQGSAYGDGDYWHDALLSTSWYSRQTVEDAENPGSYLEVEDTEWVDGRIPTIVTSEDGSRRFISPRTGQEYVLPPTASEPRTVFVLRVIAYP